VPAKYCALEISGASDPFAITVRAAYELSYSHNELGGKIGLKVTFNILSKFK